MFHGNLLNCLERLLLFSFVHLGCLCMLWVFACSRWERGSRQWHRTLSSARESKAPVLAVPQIAFLWSGNPISCLHSEVSAPDLEWGAVIWLLASGDKSHSTSLGCGNRLGFSACLVYCKIVQYLRTLVQLLLDLETSVSQFMQHFHLHLNEISALACCASVEELELTLRTGWAPLYHIASSQSSCPAPNGVCSLLPAVPAVSMQYVLNHHSWVRNELAFANCFVLHTILPV